MTTQQPFTPAGVAQKMTDLYALSNNDLSAEANSVRTDMKAWLAVNFILNTAQHTWLTEVDDQFFSFAAPLTGLAFEHRLEIELIAPNPLPTPGLSKMVRLQDAILPKFSKSGGFTVSGKLTYELEYS